MPGQKVISAAELARISDAIFTAAGVPEAEARRVTQSLVDSNLRGHDSHGVVRIPEYLRQLRRGDLVAGAELTILCETGAIVAADAGLGFGMVQCERLIERLLPKARELGVACGTMRRCGHVGRLGEWVELIAARGLAAFMNVNDNGVLQCVAPPGGTAPRISTNPLAIGVPTSSEPLALDISTSVVANGKVKVRWLAQEPCPEGWLLDSQGRPTTDPAVRFTEPRGTILPLGGDYGFKGFGLGMLLDMLVGGLSGGFCPPAPDGAPSTNNVLLVMWDPERFAGSRHFLGQADQLIAHVRSTPLRPGVDEIRLPGDRSRALLREREEHGIPLDEGTWEALRSAAGEWGVELALD